MSEDNTKLEDEKKMDSEEKPEDKEKTSETNESNKAIVDGFTKIADVLTKNIEALSKLDEKLDKALETPTDLPLKPKVSAEDDIGAKVKVPDTYQSNSQQAAIDDSDPKNTPKTDPSGLKMQEKATPVEKSVPLEKTEAPRPGANEAPHPAGLQTTGLSSIEKSYAGSDRSPILDDIRKVGLEGANQIAAKILKGDYYMPTDQEVGRF